jgi:parallel beta-helix repeat protein
MPAGGSGGMRAGTGGAPNGGVDASAGGGGSSAGGGGSSGGAAEGGAGSGTGGAADAGRGNSDGAPRQDAGTGNPPADGGPRASCAGGGPANHYVDSANGNDSFDGATPASAWRSIARVNATTFLPGNQICFHAGGSWTGELHPLGSGTAAAPIVIDQYGTGAKPHIAGGAGNLQAFSLVNQSYWEINNLEITNDQGGPGDFRGMSIRGRDVGVLHHIAIRNCLVHAVTGLVNWIGGDIADNAPPWVTFQTGWDASKRTGGIVFEIDSVNGTPSWFDDVTIESNVIQDASFGGIIFKQFDGGFGWGVRSSANDARFTPHTKIAIRNNYISQMGTAFGCNALYVTGSRGVVIEGNVIKDAGTSGIEVYNVDDLVIQKNEVFGTVRKAGGADFNGIDSDRASTKTIIQYNYIHDNGDGILLAQFAFGDSIVRYNLIVNNSRLGINLHSDAAATNQTYNNLFFAPGLGSASLIDTSGTALVGTYAVRNNIFSTTRAADVPITGTGVTYSNNLYSGLTAAAGDAAARTGDPLFTNIATHPSGDMTGPALSLLGGFKLRAGSPAINNGAVIANNGGFDFFGTALYVGAPDIGPYETP